MYKIVYLLIIISLLGCSSKSEKNENTTTATEDNVNDQSRFEDDGQLINRFVEKGDSLTIPEFEIEMQLSTQADQKLKGDGESIIVQAYITGEPKEGTGIELTEMDEIALAQPHVELTGSRVAKFKGINISKAHYEALNDKDFHILINVFSGRRTIETNLLDCDILEEPISKAGGKRHILKGKLIVE